MQFRSFEMIRFAVLLLLSITFVPASFSQSDYERLVQVAELKRVALLERFSRAQSENEKRAIVDEARRFLQNFIPDKLIPPWYGTPWDFNGTSEIPGTGSIACGYFVTTILRDAGFRIERQELAQQASECIIKSLVKPSQVKRFSDVPIESFLEAVVAWGEGLYLVGLDIHVGFILYEDEETYFIHASYVAPYQVIKEEASNSRILSASRYRVLGKLTADDELILNWLNAKKITTRKR